MADKIKIIPYSPAHKQAIIDLLDSKPFKQKIWEWQFTENLGMDRFEPVVLADKWGTIVGFNGTMPVRIKYDDKIIQGLWSCDFVVDSRYHRKGFGKLIKQELHTRAPLIMALGISDMAASVLLRMGWKKTNVLDSYRKLNRISEPRSALIAGIQYLNRIRSERHALANGATEIRFNNQLPGAEALDRLWIEIADGYKRVAVRDYSYLHWRYERHPLCAYQFLTAWQEDNLLALVVVRITSHSAHIIDYVGPAKNAGLKAALLDKLLAISSKQDYLACTTSDGEWKQSLLNAGFYKQHSRPRFYIYAAGELASSMPEDWFIMGGDSDGDMLRASEDGPFRYAALPSEAGSPELHVRQLDEDWFLGSRQEWQNLLSSSDADPLFMGWLWQTCWWKEWANKRGYRLYLLGLFEGGQLIGLAPLYQFTKKLGRVLKYKQLLFIGSSWGGGATVRSEYLDFIIRREHGEIGRHAFLNYLYRDDTWDQLIFSDMNKQSITLKILESSKLFDKYFARIVQSDTGIVIDTSGLFAVYMESMGQSGRRRTYNQRKLLKNKGEVRITFAADDAAESYIDQLNYIHSLRWGRGCFDESSLSFHKQLAKALAKEGAVKLSTISVSDKPVSVLYDIVVDGREYNIQAGIDDGFMKQVSMGLLHLGYSIENAFNDAGIREYDLLAGFGMKTFYKNKFGSKKVDFITMQYNRKYWLQCLYVFYDWLPESIKFMIRAGLGGSR